jgi:hypothetical protein
VNWIAADILRVQNGILVEHWDVIQDEAAEEQSPTAEELGVIDGRKADLEGRFEATRAGCSTTTIRR